ncbi:MAG: PAS domain-containing protein [Minwuia sp.]|uniref:PAS domain-containing protein n=1 Tax=Minwuia sp. TaxID=2493630 RepID=UPI003A87B29D
MDGYRPPFWVRMDPALNCEDAQLISLLDYWEGKKAGRVFPARRDVDPIEIRHLLGVVVMIDIEQDPFRLRYRLLGTKITQTMGRDNTGRYYDEIYGQELLSDIYKSFQWILENRAPLRTYGEAFYEDRDFYDYETLNLPLSSDGETIDMIFGGIVFHSKSRLHGPPD